MNRHSTPALLGRTAGFTLIELMITVAIIAILSAIAYPSYQQYVLKSHRSDAKTALLDLATRQERFFTLQNNYSNSPTALGYGGASFPISIQSGAQSYYQLRVTTSGAPGTNNPPGYIATATPIGPQLPDGCGTYQINQLGAQSNTGNTIASSQCW